MEEAPVVDRSGVPGKYYFLLRRLHSLTGIVPIGAFLVAHLLTNSSVVWGLLNRNVYPGRHAGASTYQHEVNFIHSLPFLLLIEVVGLWIPIAFHAALGVYYATQGRGNTAYYPYQANWRYSLQRISGYVGLLFIFYHVATLRWGWTWLVPGGVEWRAEFAASTMAQVLRGGAGSISLAAAVVAIFYMVGVTLLVFHLANGLWTAAITWGLTVTATAQRRWGQVCFGFGVVMMALAWSGVLGFLFLDQDAARAAEQSMLLHGEASQHPEHGGTFDIPQQGSPSPAHP